MPLHIQNEEGKTTNSKNRGKSDKPDKLKEYKITNKLIAKWFKYSTPSSFTGSSCKQQMLDGIKKVIEHIESLNVKD